MQHQARRGQAFWSASRALRRNGTSCGRRGIRRAPDTTVRAGRQHRRQRGQSRARTGAAASTRAALRSSARAAASPRTTSRPAARSTEQFSRVRTRTATRSRPGSGAPATRPVKDDLSNVYGCSATAADGDVLLYAGAERISANGASHIDYELFQADVGLDGPIPCTDSPCFFTGSRTIGDLIISVDFENGGAVGSVTLRRWDGTEYVIVSSSGLGCNAADTICVFSNTTAIPSGPWTTYDEHGDTTTTLPINAFTEFGLNLTELLNGNVPCTASALVKTRSSPSFTSELKDFASASFRTCPSKSGTKFHDLDGDGVKDAGEPGLAGWTIRAYKDTNANGTLDAAEAATPAASDVTDASGNYFMTFQSGRYIVCEVLQAGWAQSFPTASGASCAAGAGLAPRGWAINLAGVVDDTGNDFGNYRQATKTGVKFHDLNANGVKEAAEPGLTGWTINAYLDANGNGVRDVGENTLSATTTTGSGGTYTLSLAPGKYVVCEVQQADVDAVLPGERRVRRGRGRLGHHAHVRPARLGQQLRELPDGDQDRREVP